MTELHSQVPAQGRERNWLRLRTLVVLRWWAIAGQLVALGVAYQILELEIAYDLCFAVIGMAVISNLIATFVFPQSKRLSERETFWILLFDLLQLALMLYLTGGLSNPFSILVVGPVTVSASALSGRRTAVLAVAAIVIVTLLIEFHLPIRTEERFIMQVADIFLFGNWVAIVISILFLGIYARRVVAEMRTMSDALQATQMALAREQRLTDLGGVIAAAAHELGTPLATIKLTSSELADELKEDELRQDALLIREQADRCRDILRSMGKDDPHMRQLPLTAVVEEAAEPHIARGKQVHFEHRPKHGTIAQQPTILRRSEVIHGLRNLVQNAVDFATENVWVESRWDADQISVRIMDDGRGYPPHLLGRIGEPFMRSRPKAHRERPAYEGMGLGLFIAKTLLERSGADLTFANGTDALARRPDKSDRTGAFVEVTWARGDLEIAQDPDPLPEAQP